MHLLCRLMDGTDKSGPKFESGLGSRGEHMGNELKQTASRWHYGWLWLF